MKAQQRLYSECNWFGISTKEQGVWLSQDDATRIEEPGKFNFHVMISQHFQQQRVTDICFGIFLQMQKGESKNKRVGIRITNKNRNQPIYGTWVITLRGNSSRVVEN